MLRSYSDPGLLVSDFEKDASDLSDQRERQASAAEDLPLSQKGSSVHTQQETSGETPAPPPAAHSSSQSPAQASAQSFATSPRRHRTRSTSFVILEDCIADSQPTHTTESSVLSQRHPNSQPDRPVPSSRSGDSNDSRKLSSNSLEFEALPGFLALDSRTPPAAPESSNMSQQSSTQISPGLRASSEISRSGLREKLKILRAGSRNEADDRKSNKRNLDQTQPASASNELAVRTNLSQTFGVTTSPSAPEQISATDTGGSPSVPRTQTASNASTTQAPFAPTNLDNLVAFSRNDSPNSATSKASVHLKEKQTSRQSRIETQHSELAADVRLPLHVSQLKHAVSNPPNRPPLPEEMSSLSQVNTSLQPIHLGPMEFVVPLGMNPRVRDQYVSIIKYYHRSIEDSQKEIVSDDVLNRMRLMLDRLNRVTTHMDLDNGDDTSQEDVPVENLAMWAMNCSDKFKFLHHLFDVLRNRNLHLAIVAKSGQLLDILETFLKGNHVAYNRPDMLSKSDTKSVKGSMEVTLLPSGIEGSTSLPGGANLVIALDGSFDAQDAQVMKLRAHVTNVGQLAPVIHLLVYNSAEHIDRCISTTLDPIDRIRRIVSCLTQAGDEVGQLLPDEAPPSAAAEEVAAFVEAGGLEHDWTFPSIRPIEGIVAIEYTQGVEASTRSETQIASGQRVAASSISLKRALVG